MSNVIEYIRYLLDTPTIFWTSFDEMMVGLFCIVLIVLGFPVFVLVEWMKGPEK